MIILDLIIIDLDPAESKQQRRSESTSIPYFTTYSARYLKGIIIAIIIIIMDLGWEAWQLWRFLSTYLVTST